MHVLKKFAVLFLSLLLILVVWDYLNFRSPGIDFYPNLGQITSKNDIHQYDYSEDGVELELNALRDAFIAFNAPFTSHFWKRLSITFSNADNVRVVKVYYRLKGDPGFREEQTREGLMLGETGKFCDILLPPGEYEELRLDFYGGSRKAKLTITSIKLLDFSYFFYTEAWFYLLAVLIFSMFVLPGTVIYALFVRQERFDPEVNLLYFFCNSLLFYLLLFLVLMFVLHTGLPKFLIVTGSFFLLFGILVFLVWLRGRGQYVLQCIRTEKKTFGMVLVLIMICCFIFTGFVRSPFVFDSVNFNTIDKETIFSNFGGHDNQFQFVNGKAIADNEPFSKYYAGGALIYNVQDREMLPGVIYSVYRIFFSFFSKYIGESYLTYTIIGLCMNIMVLFPLSVLFRRYFSGRFQYLFLLILSLNTFVLPNYYFTWFKFSGAALFLSGFLVLLKGRNSFWSWFAAGLLLGLSSNMHAGNAMGIPLLFLWLIWLNGREQGFLSRSTMLYPLVLVALFALVNVPWAMIKSLYYPDNYALIRQHFFPGPDEQGLLANFIAFMQSHPIEVQLQHHLDSLANMFRFAEIKDLFVIFQEEEVAVFVKYWNNIEFFFFILSIYPMAAIATISYIFGWCQKKFQREITPLQSSMQIEGVQFFILSMLSILCIISLAWDRLPDINHMLPMGLILVIHSLLIGVSLKSSMVGRVLLGAYACVSLWRIVTFWKYYIFA